MSSDSGRVSGPDIAALAASVTGPVLTPGDAGYDAESAVFNLTITHRPAVVVGAANVGDVQAAVSFAADRDLPVAVLATGHQPIMPADGAVLITTRRMASVAVNPGARSARVGAGTLWGQVVEAAAPYGLAPLNGSSPGVGAVGYTLGGGLSTTMGRAYGWAADHVRSLDVVTADGELRHATAATERDLFWALRGGKSNFGVVTAMDIELFPVTRIYAGGLFYPGQYYTEVLDAYRAFTQAVPDQMSSSVALLRLPSAPSVPAPLRGTLTVHLRLSWIGTPEDGERLVAPLRAAAPVTADTVGEMPYTRFAEIHSDPVDPAPFAERNAMLAALTPGTVERLAELAGPDSDCTLTFVEIRHLGGALARPPWVPDAVGNRDAAYSFWAAAIGMPEDTQVPMKYADMMVERLTTWRTGGRYLNFMTSDDASPERNRAGYHGVDYQRLRAVKTVHDPANLFRLNHNIPPFEHGEEASRTDSFGLPGFDRF